MSFAGWLRRAAQQPGPIPRAPERRSDALGSSPPGGGVHRAPPPGPSSLVRRLARRPRRDAEPVDQPQAELHMCPFCRRRHQPVAMGGGGAAVYGRQIGSDPYSGRPEPLGRGPAYEPVVWDRDEYRAYLYGGD
jgi:hypothetical protein